MTRDLCFRPAVSVMISFVSEVNIKFTVQERQVYHGATVHDPGNFSTFNFESCGKQLVLIVHVKYRQWMSLL